MTDETKNKLLKYSCILLSVVMIISVMFRSYFEVIIPNELLAKIFETIGYIAETPFIVAAVVLLWKIWRTKKCQY